MKLATKFEEDKIIPITSAKVPSNLLAEKAAISCILQDLTNLDRTTWPEDLFFYPMHKTLLETARRCRERGAKSDFFAIQDDLVQRGLLESVGGEQGLIEIYSAYNTPDNEIADYHRKILIESAQYRKAMKVAQEAAQQFAEQTGNITEISAALAEITTATERQHQSLKEICEEVINELEQTEPPEAFSTRIPTLDRATKGGPKRGELCVVAAETSGGKSILLLQMALEAAKNQKPVAVFSLEMPAKDVARRMVSNLTGAQIKGMTESPNTQELKSVQSGIFELVKLPLQIESGYTDWESIETNARDLHARGKLAFLIVDYLQLVHLRDLNKNETREQHVSEITRRLKNLALSLNIGVATASQLNEEGRLRESRAIGHHADHVWLIRHADEGAILNINKNRSGERNKTIPLLMRGEISRFDERTTRE